MEYHQVSTMTEDGTQVYDERNLVVLSRFQILAHYQYRHDFAPAPRYQKVTARPEESEARPVTWERPILHARIQLGRTRILDLINVHLKSKLPTDIPG